MADCETLGSPEQEQCHKHPDYLYSVFCNDCVIPCCEHCIFDHEQHTFTNFTDGLAEIKKELLTHIHQVEKEILPANKADIEEIHQHMTKYEQNIKMIENCINAKRISITVELNRLCDQLLAEAMHVKHQDMAKMKAIIREWEDWQGNLQCHLQACKHKLQAKCSEIVKFVREGPDLRLLNPLQAEYPLSPKFVPGSIDMPALRSLIGTIQSSDEVHKISITLVDDQDDSSSNGNTEKDESSSSTVSKEESSDCEGDTSKEKKKSTESTDNSQTNNGMHTVHDDKHLRNDSSRTVNTTTNGCLNSVQEKKSKNSVDSMSHFQQGNNLVENRNLIKCKNADQQKMIASQRESRKEKIKYMERWIARQRRIADILNSAKSSKIYSETSGSENTADQQNIKKEENENGVGTNSPSCGSHRNIKNDDRGHKGYSSSQGHPSYIKHENRQTQKQNEEEQEDQSQSLVAHHKTDKQRHMDTTKTGNHSNLPQRNGRLKENYHRRTSASQRLTDQETKSQIQRRGMVKQVQNGDITASHHQANPEVPLHSHEQKYKDMPNKHGNSTPKQNLDNQEHLSRSTNHNNRDKPEKANDSENLHNLKNQENDTKSQRNNSTIIGEPCRNTQASRNQTSLTKTFEQSQCNSNDVPAENDTAAKTDVRPMKKALKVSQNNRKCLYENKSGPTSVNSLTKQNTSERPDNGSKDLLERNKNANSSYKCTEIKTTESSQCNGDNIQAENGTPTLRGDFTRKSALELPQNSAENRNKQKRSHNSNDMLSKAKPSELSNSSGDNVEGQNKCVTSSHAVPKKKTSELPLSSGENTKVLQGHPASSDEYTEENIPQSYGENLQLQNRSPTSSDKLIPGKADFSQHRGKNMQVENRKSNSNDIHCLEKKPKIHLPKDENKHTQNKILNKTNVNYQRKTLNVPQCNGSIMEKQRNHDEKDCQLYNPSCNGSAHHHYALKLTGKVLTTKRLHGHTQNTTKDEITNGKGIVNENVYTNGQDNLNHHGDHGCNYTQVDSHRAPSPCDSDEGQGHRSHSDMLSNGVNTVPCIRNSNCTRTDNKTMQSRFQQQSREDNSGEKLTIRRHMNSGLSMNVDDTMNERRTHKSSDNRGKMLNLSSYTVFPWKHKFYEDSRNRTKGVKETAQKFQLLSQAEQAYNFDKHQNPVSPKRYQQMCDTARSKSDITVKVQRSFKCKLRVDNITTTLDNNIWVGSWGKKSLKLYDDSGTEIKSVVTDFCVQSFTSTETGELVVVNSTKHCVLKLSSSGEFEKILDTFPVLPRGILINSSQQIMITGCAPSEKIPGKLVKYSSDGKNKLQEICEDENGRPLYHTPNKIAQSTSGDYCVIDEAYGCIVTVNKDGGLLWSYKGAQVTHRMKTFYPTDICCDKQEGLIIISDQFNDVIDLVDNDGKFLAFLLTQEHGIFAPRGLCISSLGILYMGQTNGKVFAIEYLSQSDE